MRFATNQGFNTGDHFYTYLKDSFDALYEEGKTNPKMMSNKNKSIQVLTKGVEFLFKKNKVTYFKGTGKLKSCCQEKEEIHQDLCLLPKN